MRAAERRWAPELSERGAVAARGEISFCHGWEEDGTRLPTPQPVSGAGALVLGPFLTRVCCVTLEFMATPGPPFPHLYTGRVGPGQCQGLSQFWFSACQLQEQEKQDPLCISQTVHPQVDRWDEMVGKN